MTVIGRRLLVLARRPRAVAGFALALVVLGLAGWYLHLEWQFERGLEDARRAEERFDFEAERKYLDQCQLIQPRDAETRLRLARNARRSGDFTAAQADLNAHQELVAGPTPESTLETALLQVQQGNLPVAETFLRERLRNGDPKTPLILEALSRGCVRVYRLQDALRWADELLARQPGNVLAWLVRGMVHESAGRTELALESFQAALKYQPENVEARGQLAETLLRLQRPAEAREHLERLRADHPSAEVTLAMAHCYRLLGRLDEAAALLEPLARERPKDGAVLKECGQTALAAGRLAEAEDWLRSAVAAAPADRAANDNFARCLQLRGKEAEAEHYLHRSTEIGADLKQLAEAADQAMQAPGDPRPRLQAGLICLRNDQDRQGVRWLLGALQVDPAHRPTHQALADYYERSGQSQQAAEHRRLASAPADGRPAKR